MIICLLCGLHPPALCLQAVGTRSLLQAKPYMQPPAACSFVYANELDGVCVRLFERPTIHLPSCLLLRQSHSSGMRSC